MSYTGKRLRKPYPFVYDNIIMDYYKASPEMMEKKGYYVLTETEYMGYKEEDRKKQMEVNKDCTDLLVKLNETGQTPSEVMKRNEAERKNLLGYKDSYTLTDYEPASKPNGYQESKPDTIITVKRPSIYGGTAEVCNYGYRKNKP